MVPQSIVAGSLSQGLLCALVDVGKYLTLKIPVRMRDHFLGL